MGRQRSRAVEASGGTAGVLGTRAEGDIAGWTGGSAATGTSAAPRRGRGAARCERARALPGGVRGDLRTGRTADPATDTRCELAAVASRRERRLPRGARVSRIWTGLVALLPERRVVAEPVRGCGLRAGGGGVRRCADERGVRGPGVGGGDPVPAGRG